MKITNLCSLSPLSVQDETKLRLVVAIMISEKKGQKKGEGDVNQTAEWTKYDQMNHLTKCYKKTSRKPSLLPLKEGSCMVKEIRYSIKSVNLHS